MGQSSARRAAGDVAEVMFIARSRHEGWGVADMAKEAGTSHRRPRRPPLSVRHHFHVLWTSGTLVAVIPHSTTCVGCFMIISSLKIFQSDLKLLNFKIIVSRGVGVNLNF